MSIISSGTSAPRSFSAPSSKPKASPPTSPAPAPVATPSTPASGANKSSTAITSTAPAAPPESPADPHIDPAAIHMTQFRSDFNPHGDPASSDCGPTALAMGLKGLGLDAPGVTDSSSVQDEIDASRSAMFTDSNGNVLDAARDGYSVGSDGKWKRNYEEHMTLSGFDNVKRGAANSGANTVDVHNVDEVRDQVSQGHPVVLGGNPNAPGAYGHREGIGYNGGHFILVSGYDAESGNYTVNDPLSRKGPFQVTPAELKGFINDPNFGSLKGVALERGDGQAVAPARDFGSPVPPGAEHFSSASPPSGNSHSAAPSGSGNGNAGSGGQAAISAQQGTSGVAGSAPDSLDGIVSKLCQAILGAAGQGSSAMQTSGGAQTLMMVLDVLLMQAQSSGVQLSAETQALVNRVHGARS